MYSYMSVYSNITYLIMYGIYVFICYVPYFSREQFFCVVFLLDVSHFGVVVSASIDRSYGCYLLSVCWVWDPAFFVPVSNHAALRYLILPAHKDVHVC